MVSCHNCFIYETWRNKEVGRVEVLKSSFRGASLQGVDQILYWQLTPLDNMCLSAVYYFPLKHNKSFRV